MMKKFMIGVGILITLLLVLGFVFRDTIGMMLAFAAMQPDQDFAEDTRHEAPDYSQFGAWAALPSQDDMADVTPAGAENLQAEAVVDVFFIHPTTYYKNEFWLQPLDDADANRITDEQVMRGQAAVFNTCCAVYAPRYRQATLFSFMDTSGDGQQAIAFAYEDVEDAFDYYLAHYNQGRPFIIAGHSQGGLHADTLLKNKIAGTDLESRLVAAYPVGYYITGEGSVPVCENATQTGCQATWNAVAPDSGSFQDTTASICINPINWKNDGSRADYADHLGAVDYGAEGQVEQGVVDAQCVNGRLHVSEVRSPNYKSQFMGPGNYHIYDFSFFHLDIRQNAVERVDAYLNAQVIEAQADLTLE